MTITMDKSGRVVIPKELRKAANLQPDMPLEIRVENGGVVIETPWIESKIEMRHGLAVLVFPEGTPKMSVEDFDRIRDEIDEERFPGVFGKKS
jgi:AbrB family looped-hinge helix DNA binding protein